MCAENLIVDKIEVDIAEKERFVSQQNKTINEMYSGINKQVDYCWVLSEVAKQANEIKRMFQVN